VDVAIYGNTNGYLYEVTNNVNSDTNYIRMQEPVIRIGAYPSSNIVDVQVADYTHKQCKVQSGLLSAACTLVSVNELENELLIYPNPADNFITIKLNDFAPHSYRIAISDAIGKKVFQAEGMFEQGKTDLTIPLQNLSSGIYLLQFNGSDNYSPKVVRFVKK
jgi:hypothetical protein